MSASAPPRAPIPNLADLSLVIDTSRLKLRPLVESDVDDLWPHASDPDLSAFMSWSAHKDRAETKAFVDAQIDGMRRGTDLTWAIEHEGKVWGCISFGGIKWTFRAWRIDRAELGYWLAIPMWGQGYISEAALAATRWGFETLGLHKITIGCIEGNRASQRIIEKIGYRFLCKQEDDVWRDGKWWNHLRYEMTAAEWGDTARTMRFSRPRPPT
jgi:RimJ/RimL family protein N-acetyltransferase